MCKDTQGPYITDLIKKQVPDLRIGHTRKPTKLTHPKQP